MPGFKTTYLRYLDAVVSLSHEFTGLVAEALGLPPDGLAHFYGPRDERTQHRSKVGAPRAQSCPSPCDEDPLPIYARAAREP